MSFIFQPLNHFRSVRRWAAANGATIEFDVASFVLTLSRADRQVCLKPRFAVDTPNGLAYSPAFGDAGGFVGWLHYDIRRWELAVDKLLFKQWCADNDLRTPEWGSEALPAGQDFLVKGRRGSFGQGILGPFSREAASKPSSLPKDGFYEAFKFGRSIKAWFWRDRPIVVEVIDPPFVLGDGRWTVEALLGQVRGSFDRSYTIAGAQEMLSWQGLSAQDIPQKGRKVWIGFKYMTPYDGPRFNDRDVLSTLKEEVRDQFVRAGLAFKQAIPKDLRDSSLYTIDAVVDAQGLVWFLEMNCHPMIHPSAYAPLLTDLFAEDQSAAAVGP